MVRITEHNEWIFFTLLGCIAILVFLFSIYLREHNLRTFIIQKFSDSNNQMVIWVVVSLVFITLISMLFSGYIPVVPGYLGDYNLFGVGISKFWFLFLVFSVYYLLKLILSYVFFYVTDDVQKWVSFYYVSTKYYFVFSIILIIANVINYYFPIDRLKSLPIYFMVLSAFFIIKLLLFVFNRNNILPSPWYYKILYICTLQIAPVLVLWKLIFY